MDKKSEIERNSILRLINSIENETGRMFHEVLPEVDMEFHELAYNDVLRLKSIRICLAHFLDGLCMD